MITPGDDFYWVNGVKDDRLVFHGRNHEFLDAGDKVILVDSMEGEVKVRLNDSEETHWVLMEEVSIDY